MSTSRKRAEPLRALTWWRKAGAAALLFLAACSPGGSEDPGARTGEAVVSTEAHEPVVLTSVTVEEWRAEIAARRGEIIVVDMWATWCIPCIERFPHMVELYHRYRDRGVTFVSTCLDDPGDALAVDYARRFLNEQQAVFTNFLITENTADAFEKLDLLSIPAVYLYDRDGELTYRLTADDPNNQFTDEDVENAIQELLRAATAS